MTMTFIITLLLIIFFTTIIGLLVLNPEITLTQQTHYRDIDAIEDLLPQTQCGDCGFNGCRPYAEAIASHNADINQCLPGGMETVKALALKTGKEVKLLYKATNKYEKQSIAFIEEEHCIGCVKCIAACPVDAILGAPKQMHSIINSYCTGCELCIAPCPVDCISMVTRH